MVFGEVSQPRLVESYFSSRAFVAGRRETVGRRGDSQARESQNRGGKSNRARMLWLSTQETSDDVYWHVLWVWLLHIFAWIRIGKGADCQRTREYDFAARNEQVFTFNTHRRRAASHRLWAVGV